MLEQGKIDPSGLTVEAGDEDGNEDEWTRILKNEKLGSNDKVN